MIKMAYINELLGFDKLIFAFLLIILLYWLFSSKSKRGSDGDFDKYYNEIINSDKYKVKGKYESNE